jgi:hypothetical protein
MRLFGCEACKAKDEEIAWLRNELEIARRTMVEALKPGTTRVTEEPPPRVEGVERPKPKPAAVTFPGYEPGPPSGGVEVT